jgi:O-antigen/teichoic acid export membrane protein
LAFANFLSKEAFGTYRYAQSLFGALSFLTFTGINTAVTQMVAEGHATIVSYSIRLQIKYNIAFTLATFLLAIYFWINQNTTLAYSLIVAAVGFPIIATFNTYGAVLGGRKQFHTSALYGSLSTIFLGAVLIGTLATTSHVPLIMLAYCVGNALPTLYFYRKTLATLPPQISTSQERQSLLGYARHISLINIFSTLSQYADKIILFHYFGAIQLATYAIAQAIPERIRGFSKNINNIVLPRVTSRSISEIQKIFYTRVFQAFGIGLLISGLYIVMAPMIFHIFLPQYIESLRYSQVLSLSFALTMPGGYVASVFYGKKLLKTIYLSSVSAHVSRILLFWILGKHFGVWGLIGASLSVHSIGMLYNFYLWNTEIQRQSAS